MSYEVARDACHYGHSAFRAGYPPFAIQRGISLLLCVSQPLTGQEESLCHRYPAPPAHLGWSPYMVSNLFSSSCLLRATSSVRIFSFVSLWASLAHGTRASTSAFLLVVAIQAYVSWCVPPHEKQPGRRPKKRAHFRVPKRVGLCYLPASPGVLGRVLHISKGVFFFHLVSKEKPNENSHQMHNLF